MRMSPVIAVEVVPHVDQLLADDDLQGMGCPEVDPGSIDQDRVSIRLAQKAVGAAVTGGHPPAQPASEDSTLVGHPEVLRWQCQPGHILVDESGDVGAANLRPSQDSCAASSPASPAARRALRRSTVSTAWRKCGMTILPPTTSATLSASISSSSLKPASTH